MNYFALAISVGLSLCLVIGIYIGYMIADRYYMEKESEEAENERWQILMAKDWFKENSKKED